MLHIYKKIRGYTVVHLGEDGLRERFQAIYANKVWVNSGINTPLSGAGSALHATDNLRAELPAILDQIGAKSILDLGCGDFTWMSQIILKQRYIGADIVEAVIEENRRKFPNHEFLHLDGSADNIPSTDAVLCREVLFHLSLADIHRVLAQVRRSGAKHFIATSDDITGFNADIQSGDYRVLNLRRAPFRFPTPIARIDDGAIIPGRYIGVWETSNI